MTQSIKRVTSEYTDVENIELNLLPSLSRTATPAASPIKNMIGRDLYVVVGVTGGNIAGQADVRSLAVTAAPTSTGNVAVTLNGVAVNVAVTIGTAEVDTLTVTAAPTAIGNVGVTLNGTTFNTAVDPAVQTTAGLVGDAIRANSAAFTGWTVGGAGGSATVTFTKQTVGTNTAPAFVPNATGATGTITATTAGVAADTTTTVATKIRAAAFTGWTTGGAGTTVTFTATTIGLRNGTYSCTGVGVTGTITVTTTGYDACTLTPKISGVSPSGGVFTLLLATAISANGTYVYMVSKNANGVTGGITAVADAAIPKGLQVDITHSVATTPITYYVDCMLCM